MELKSYPDEAAEEALSRKLELEFEFASNKDVEVALFESRDEATLRTTHSRYFENAANIAERLSKAG